jgi:Mg-chelatase subunit ChlD
MSTTDRWRLVLGRYSQARLPQWQDGEAGRMGDALDFLYGREYTGRDARPDGERDGGPDKGPGSLDDSVPHLVAWLHEVRELFPRETVETLERHALERYELTGLVSDPEVLAGLEPNQALLRTLLGLRGQLDGRVLDEVRRIIRAVVEELRRKIESEVRQALSGKRSQHRHSLMPVASNFDPRGTIRANLAHWDPERQRLLVADPKFFERNVRRLPWEVILCVDQSGSMVDSVIHSAVMAGILAGLPSFRLKMVVFDTNVVDLSDSVDDPVELLLSVQLGGGTDIGQAVRYCAQLIENPHRTVLVLITDFCEGAPPSQLVAAVRRLAEDRVTMVGLAALDDQAHPSYDKAMAQTLADEGMHVGAMTPKALAEWLAEVTRR